MTSGVHDSYWTHACDVDEMNKILREKFVELYEAPILENVSSFHRHIVSSRACPDFQFCNSMLVEFKDKRIVTSFLLWDSQFTQRLLFPYPQPSSI